MPDPKKKQGYDNLVDHFLPYYPDVSREQLYQEITTDPKIHDRAMREYHKANYWDRSYLTFQQQWYKKFGEPGFFTPDPESPEVPVTVEDKLTPEVQPEEVEIAGDTTAVEDQNIPAAAAEAPESTVSVPIPIGTTGFSFPWKVKESSLKDVAISDEDLAKLSDATKKSQWRASYEALAKERDGDYDTVADELDTSPLKIQESRVRMRGRSPVEMFLGTKKGGETLETYNAGLQVLYDDIQKIPRAISHLDGELENKYGADWKDMIQQDIPETAALRKDIAQDPLFQEREKLAGLGEKTLARAKAYMEDPKFEGVKAYYETQKVMQARADAQVRGGLDPKYLEGMAGRAFGKMLGGIGTLMDIGDKIATKDKTYNAWDAAEDFLIHAGRDLQEYVFPLPTQAKRGMHTLKAPWTLDGKSVIVEYDKKTKKPTAIRDMNGALYKTQVDELSKAQRAAINALEPEGSINWASAVMKTGEVLADLAVQIAGTKGIGTAGMAAGMSANTAGTVGLMATVMGQMAEPTYESLSASLGDTRQAAIATLLSTAAVGLGSSVFGLEKQLAGLSGVAKSEGAQIMAGAVKSLTKANNFTRAAVAGRKFIQAGVGESFEESIPEPIIQGGVAMMFGAKPDDIDREQMMETAAISFATGLLGGVANVERRPSFLQGQALYLASLNPDLFEKQMIAAIDAGVIKVPKGKDPKLYASQQRERALDISKQMEAYSDRIPDNLDMGEFARLLDERRRVKMNIDQAKALEWGKTKTESMQLEMERIDAAIDRSLRKKKVEMPPKAPEPTPDISFMPDPVQETPVVQEETLEGAVVGYDGQQGIVSTDGDQYVVSTEEGKELTRFPSKDHPLDHNVRVRSLPSPRVPPAEKVLPGMQPEQKSVPPAPAGRADTPAAQPGVEAPVTQETTPQQTAPPVPPASVLPGNAEQMNLPAQDIPETAQAQEELQQEMPELFTTGEDITPEEEGFDATVGDKLDVGINLGMRDYANQDHSALEAMVAGVANSELDQMLAKFRALPEHPNNYDPADPNAEALKESFERHKRNFISDLEKWAGIDPRDAREAAAPDDVDMEAIDSELEALADEYDDTFWEKAAEKIRQQMGDLDSEVDVEEIEASTQPEEVPYEPPQTEAEIEMENWQNLDQEGLKSLEAKLTHDINKTQRDYAKIQQQASEEAADMTSYTYDDEFNPREYIREQTQPYVNKLKKLRDNRKQVQKLIAEKNQDPAVSEEVKNDESGIVMNNDIGFFGVGLEYVAEIFNVAYQYLLTSPKMSRFRKITGIGQDTSRLKLKSVLFTSGHLGDYRIWDLDQQRINRINGYTARAGFINKRFRKNVKKHLGKLTPEEIEGLDNILKDPNLMYKNNLPSIPGQPIPTPAWVLPGGRGVPNDVINDLRAMRQLVSELSQELITANVVDGDLATIITENLNCYVTRQYEAHFNENWEKEVSADKSIGSVWGKAKLWSDNHLQKLHDDLTGRITEAESHLAYAEAQVSAGNAAFSAKVEFWNKRLDDMRQSLAGIANSRANLDGYVSALLHDQTDKMTGTAGARSGSIGGRNLGILKERGKGARKERAGIVSKIKKSEARWKALAATKQKLDKLIAQKSNSPGGNFPGPGPQSTMTQQAQGNKAQTPLALRDRKIAAQRQRSKYKSRLKRLEERMAKNNDTTQRSKDRVDLYKKKIRHYEGIIRDLNDQIAFQKKQEGKELNDLIKQVTKVNQAIGIEVQKAIDLARELDRVNEQDIPQELRDLWGEVKDPSMNFMTTIHKQAHLLSNHIFLNDLVDKGMNRFLFVTPPDTKFSYEISTEGSPVLQPLAGLYTSKEIRDAMMNYNKGTQLSDGMAKLMYLSSGTKVGLTVLNHIVSLRNVLSAALSFNFMQGDFGRGAAAFLNWMLMDGNSIGIALRAIGVGKNYNGPKDTGPTLMDKIYSKLGTPTGNAAYDYMKGVGLGVFDSIFGVADKKAWQDANLARQLTFGVDVWNLTPDGLESEYAQANEEGLWDEAFTYGAYLDAVEQYKGKQYKALKEDTKFANNVANWIVKAPEKLKDGAVNRYRSTDNAGRYFRYLTERSKYARAYFGKRYEDLDPREQKIVRGRAAEIAKQTYPTLSRVPKAFKELSKNVLFGDFVTFQVAMMANQFNTVKLGFSEMRDPRTAGYGFMRLTGVAVTDFAAKAAFQSLAAMVGGVFSDGWDDVEDRTRMVLPDYMKDAPLIGFPSYDEEGNPKKDEVNVINMAPIFPTSVITRTIWTAGNALMGRQVSKYRSNKKEITQGADAIIRPFYAPGIAYERLMEALNNTEELGKEYPLYGEYDTPKQKLGTILGHIFGIKGVNRRQIGDRYIPLPEIESGGLVPGTFYTIDRLTRALLGEPTNWGTMYDPKKEIFASMTGIRVTPTAFEKPASRKFKSIGANYKQMNYSWKQVAGRSYLSKLDDDRFWSHPDVIAKMASVQESYDRAISEGIGLKDALVDQGFSMDEVYEMVKGTGLPAEAMVHILKGEIGKFGFERVAPK